MKEKQKAIPSSESADKSTPDSLPLDLNVDDRRNWDFSEMDGKPQHELRTCCYWEYARESKFIRSVRERCHQIADWGLSVKDRHELVGANFDKIRCELGRTAHLFQEGIYGLGGTKHYAGVATPFPQPWQSLKEEMRSILLETAAWNTKMVADFPAFRWSHVACASGLAEHLRRLQSCPEGGELSGPNAGPSLKDYYWSGEIPRTERPSVISEDGIEVLLVEIDWRGFTNDKIVECFRKWVRAHRPKDVKSPSGQGHDPQDWRAKLERLGLLRLRHYHTVEDAIQILCKTFPPDKRRSKFTEPGEINREAEKAVDYFHRIFPFLDLAERPLSWPILD